MKEKYSSFICEHTAEFVLIPILKAILKQRYEIVIPIFPWLTREGGRLSQIIHKEDKFNVIGLYPKRPKINLGDDKILVKINSEFVSGAEEASKFNIPMIVGSPIVKNLWELNEPPACIWIKLNALTKPLYFIEYAKEISPGQVLENANFLNNGTDILKCIDYNCEQFDLDRLMIAIRSIRESSSALNYNYRNYGSYKPVYFLLKHKLSN